MALYPLAVATQPIPIPVFPDVGSIIVEPGFNIPLSSASSIMASATLSLTEPAGLKYSSFARIAVSSALTAFIYL